MARTYRAAALMLRYPSADVVELMPAIAGVIEEEELIRQASSGV